MPAEGCKSSDLRRESSAAVRRRQHHERELAWIQLRRTESIVELGRTALTVAGILGILWILFG